MKPQSDDAGLESDDFASGSDSADRGRIEMTRLTEEDLERFHRNAKAALARRGRSYMIDEVSRGLQTALFGALPIIGMIFWEWSGIEMLLFLIVSLWVGIFCDMTKFVRLQERARAFADARYNDFHVWVVADALRAGKAVAPTHQLRARWEPWAGIFIDFVFGIVSTLMILGALVLGAGVDLGETISRGLSLGMAAMMVTRIFSTIWEIREHRQVDTERGDVAVQAADRPVKVAVGLRGIALFLVMFLVVGLTEELDETTDKIWIIAMCVINGLVVFFGLLNAAGWLWIRGETRWLREYLEQEQVA